MTNILKIKTIQEMKDSNISGQTYQLNAFVREIFRTKEGLNIFTVSDGEQDFKLVKFIAGSAAYPELEKGSISSFIFTKKQHGSVLQGQIEDLKTLSKEIQDHFMTQLEARKLSQYKPVNENLLFDTPAFNAMKGKLNQVATLIRKAVIEHRPIIISHHNDVDGFTAGLLLEDAIKPLILKHYPLVKFMANFLNRYPSRTPFYDLTDATKDISLFLQNMERADTKPPLVLIVDNGSTPQDILAIKKVKLFGADVAVIDHHDPRALDENGQSVVCKETIGHVNPHLDGITQNISASLICYELSNLINESIIPNKHSSLLGAVADKCEGAEVDILLKGLDVSRERYESLAKIGDYEIYQTKINLPQSALFDFLRGKHLDELTAIYKPLLDEERVQITSMVTNYEEKKTLGKFNLHFLNGELTTLRGDYYQISKLAAILHETHAPNNNEATCVYSDSMIVFRVRQEETIFDINKLIPYLQDQIPHARITGGGHAVAGSIKALPIAMKDILSLIEEFISSL